MAYVDEPDGDGGTIRRFVNPFEAESGDEGSSSEEEISIDSSDANDELLLQELVSAASYNDILRCTTALDNCEQHGCDANRLTSNGRGSLLASSEAGHSQMIELLMLHGVRASSRGRNNAICLQLSCTEGHTECTRLLLVKGSATVDDVDGSGATALFKACAGGHAGCAALLIEHGAKLDVARPVSLDTALQAASAGGHAECIEQLLKHRAATDLVNSAGSTALHLASYEGHMVAVQLLCSHGCSVSAADETGRTALHVAVSADNGAVCRLLLAHAAACERESELGATPLLEAIERGHETAARCLLELGASVDGLDAHSLAALESLIDRSADAVESKAELISRLVAAKMPLEFAEQASRLPPSIRRLLVENADPKDVSAAAVLRASGVGRAQGLAAWRDLYRPASEVLMQASASLDGTACAALRKSVDDAAQKWESGAWCPHYARNGKDTVDGLRDWQVNLDRTRLAALVTADAFETITRTLPARYDQSRGSAQVEPPLSLRHRLAACSLAHSLAPQARLMVRQAFVRRYTAATRPWFAFHTDTAQLTANIALSASTEHEGGELLALLEGTVQRLGRSEGEATVHPSSLLHGVSRIRGGVRYSLIVFYEECDLAEGGERDHLPW